VSERLLRRAEMLLALEGTALLRSLLDADETFVAERVAAIRRLALSDAPEWDETVSVEELSVSSGYQRWAPTYDQMVNSMIRAEEPLVERALRIVSPGRALDAACGTGRHAARLAAAGCSVIGVDSSEAMLGLARAKHPEVDWQRGQLTELPLPSGGIDVAVCALALTHLPDLDPAVAELARVVRPGGQIVLSDAHPSFVMLWGQALFPAGPARLSFVRNHVHLHSAYLRVFARHGLAVVDCDESPMEADFSMSLWRGSTDAADALWRDLPAVLVWNLTRS
jgi:ubiquinone/menaquinone biosynthesis C-methylase UbiE